MAASAGPTPDTDFDGIAPYYDNLSRLVFGNALRRAQAAYLSAIPEQAHVLLIGGGSGWLLEQLLSQKPSAKVTYLESSTQMLRLSRKRIATNPTLSDRDVAFLLGTESKLDSNETFDVIITPFLLDLFKDDRLQLLLDRLFTALQPQGLWLFSDFWPVRQPAPLWQRLLLKAMYAFFGNLSNVEAHSLPDFERHFSRYALRELQVASYYGGLVQAKLYRKG